MEYAGEHWAEKIAAEIAAVLGIPHATVELAQEQGSHVPGVISRDITADVPHGELIHGNDLLVEIEASYPRNRLIGNTDRHHENWALRVSRHEGGRIRMELAPSYDHASSLGRELSDDSRARRLSTRDDRATVEAYARKARSAIYRDERDHTPMTPLMAYIQAATQHAIAGRAWYERLR